MLSKLLIFLFYLLLFCENRLLVLKVYFHILFYHIFYNNQTYYLFFSPCRLVKHISHFLCFLYTIDAAVTPFINAYLTIDCLYFYSCVILFIWNTSFMILFFVKTNFIITGIPFIIIFYIFFITVTYLL